MGWVAIGVSIACAIALHNIPEGVVSVERGAGRKTPPTYLVEVWGGAGATLPPDSEPDSWWLGFK